MWHDIGGLFNMEPYIRASEIIMALKKLRDKAKNPRKKYKYENEIFITISKIVLLYEDGLIKNDKYFNTE